MKRVGSVLVLMGAAAVAASAGSPPARVTSAVELRRVPNGGIQPEAVLDRNGVLHMIYFAGSPAGGDLFYVRSRDFGATFTAPVRVNSQPGSAIATGTIRGGQLALGRGGRVHVGWNGSDTAMPRGIPPPGKDAPGTPYLYARSNAAGTAFEPQRNLNDRSYGLDGGSIAADAAGHVYAAWHALPAGQPGGEDHRRVWLSRSSDEGASFTPSEPIDGAPAGVCGCCGLRAFATPGNRLLLLYRAALPVTSRDMTLLVSPDAGATFARSLVQSWQINACPMTSASLAAAGSRVLGAWETAGQVYFGAIDPSSATIASPIAAPGDASTRKHPRLAIGADRTLLVWTQGTAWAKGGSVMWQAFDAAGKPVGETGSAPGLPVWSFAAAVPRPDGGFTLFY